MNKQNIVVKSGRLEAASIQLTKEDFDAVAETLGVSAGFAVKAGDSVVAAMNVVDTPTEVATINTQDGSVQTENIAQCGDAILTRLNPDGSVKLGITGRLDQWVVSAKNIAKLYTAVGGSNEYGQLVAGNNQVYFIKLANGGILEAPWGGAQEISAGVLQYSVVSNEVYLNETDGFEAAFTVIQSCA